MFSRSISNSAIYRTSVFARGFTEILDVSRRKMSKILEGCKIRITRPWALWVEYKDLVVTIFLLKTEGSETRENINKYRGY